MAKPLRSSPLARSAPALGRRKRPNLGTAELFISFRPTNSPHTVRVYAPISRARFPFDERQRQRVRGAPVLVSANGEPGGRASAGEKRESEARAIDSSRSAFNIQFECLSRGFLMKSPASVVRSGGGRINLRQLSAVALATEGGKQSDFGLVRPMMWRTHF